MMFLKDLKSAIEHRFPSAEQSELITRRALVAGGCGLLGMMLFRVGVHSPANAVESGPPEIENVWGDKGDPLFGIKPGLNYQGGPVRLRDYLALGFSREAGSNLSLENRETQVAFDRAFQCAASPTPIKIQAEPAELTAASRYEGSYPGNLNLAYTIFKKLTGQDVPEEITVSVGHAAVENNCRSKYLSVEKIAGCIEGSSNKIFSRTASPTYVTFIVLHELGHAVSVLTNSKSRGLSSSLEAVARQESSAYAFELTGLRTIQDPKMRSYCHLVAPPLHLLAQYYLGKGTDKPHPLGVALADAALTVFSDPADAMRHLSSDAPLHPEIERVILGNQRLVNTMIAPTFLVMRESAS